MLDHWTPSVLREAIAMLDQEPYAPTHDHAFAYANQTSKNIHQPEMLANLTSMLKFIASLHRSSREDLKLKMQAARVCEKILSAGTVALDRNRLAPLWYQYHRSLAIFSDQRADYQQALWHCSMALQLERYATADSSTNIYLLKLKLEQRLGSPIYKKVHDLVDKVSSSLAFDILCQSVVLEGIKEATGLTDWHHAQITALENGDLRPLMNVMKRRNEVLGFEHQLLVKLWSYAHKQRKWIDKATRVTRLNSLLPRSSRTPSQQSLWKACSALETAFEFEIPLNLRLQKLGNAKAERHMLPSLLHELVFLAALSRTFGRLTQGHLASLAKEEFLRMSRGLGGVKLVYLIGSPINLTDSL